MVIRGKQVRCEEDDYAGVLLRTGGFTGIMADDAPEPQRCEGMVWHFDTVITAKWISYPIISSP